MRLGAKQTTTLSPAMNRPSRQSRTPLGRDGWPIRSKKRLNLPTLICLPLPLAGVWSAGNWPFELLISGQHAPVAAIFGYHFTASLGFNGSCWLP